MNKLKKTLLFLLLFILIIFIAYFSFKFFIIHQFNSVSKIEKSAQFGESIELSKNNLNIRINNFEIPENSNKFNITLDFSTVNEQGLNQDILFDYLLYDENKNILASSYQYSGKNKFLTGFIAKNYNSIFYKTFTKHYIGVGNIGANISDLGKIQQYIEITLDDLQTNKFSSLTLYLHNIQYKELYKTDQIVENTDFLFNFHK